MKDLIVSQPQQRPCPHCGKLMIASTPAAGPPPLPVPITKTNESWHDRPPLT